MSEGRRASVRPSANRQGNETVCVAVGALVPQAFDAVTANV